jgi:hypothetical protein
VLSQNLSFCLSFLCHWIRPHRASQTSHTPALLEICHLPLLLLLPIRGYHGHWDSTCYELCCHQLTRTLPGPAAMCSLPSSCRKSPLIAWQKLEMACFHALVDVQGNDSVSHQEVAQSLTEGRFGFMEEELAPKIHPSITESPKLKLCHSSLHRHPWIDSSSLVSVGLKPPFSPPPPQDFGQTDPGKA